MRKEEFFDKPANFHVGIFAYEISVFVCFGIQLSYRKMSNVSVVGRVGEMGWSYSLATLYQDLPEISRTECASCSIHNKWKR